MTPLPAYIAGIGIVSALGTGTRETEKALRENRSAIHPLTLFPLLQGQPLPVGEINNFPPSSTLPRTHQLALRAAGQAMAGHSEPPGAVIIGTTTGGILTTEQLLRENCKDKSRYRYHGLTTVAETLAESYRCTGPQLTVSTACSSGAVAITLALRMLREGLAPSVLVGGVDSLCRLTYFGFHSLQLVDREGCRPLDRKRQGMAVAEGAGMLLLTGKRPQNPLGEVLGAGLSCDAYHPAAPHPEGRGAVAAMEQALADAGLAPQNIDYLNLHGTGTPDNDLAESKAVHRVFSIPPQLSSIKGATGHSLAAAGALEAVVASLCISGNLVPANTGCSEPDPALDLSPVLAPVETPVERVLSNSFGFGGNNGCLVLGRTDSRAAPVPTGGPERWLGIFGSDCLTGAGEKKATIDRLLAGKSCAGSPGDKEISLRLKPAMIRRLKRLPRMTLALAAAAEEDASLPERPSSIFMGTGWGALSETYDFLDRLAQSDEQFPSPTDFVGSVHNGPASQAALLLGATGANITTSGGDCSFEQALLSAGLMLDNTVDPALLIGADEGHKHLSPLLDQSIPPGSAPADGGGVLVVSGASENAPIRVRLPFYSCCREPSVIDRLVSWCALSGKGTHSDIFILAGIPAATRREGELQLEAFLTQTGQPPVLRYRELVGEFASASAVAAVAATTFLATGTLPGGRPAPSRIVVLGLGNTVTAMEFARP